MNDYTIVTKDAVEWGQAVTLYSAVFADGYQTVWYSDCDKAVAAAERRKARL